MKRALFIQVTEPGAYPPLVNAASLMAEAGWQVTFLATPIVGSKLNVPSVQGVEVIEVAHRSSFMVSKPKYLQYCARAIALARKLKPDIVYVSDPNGTLAGLLTARACDAQIIYHEHDSPNSELELNSLIRRARRAVFDDASLIVFPNAVRARLAQEQSSFDSEKLRIVWNVPRLSELPSLADKPRTPFVLYYHGSINPERLPESVLEAVANFDGALRLDVAGYEAPGANGYIAALLSKWNREGREAMRYLGEQHHSDLLQLAKRCHAGLALMPMNSVDINMRHMVGASNKAFDYMASGLPLIVSDLPAWREVFVDAGYGKTCDPRSVESVRSVLTWLIQNPESTLQISKRCRKKIEKEWNYEAEFYNVLRELKYLKKQG